MTNKKLVIPAILAATILVAGMFALMPVEKVSTVHTTIQANSSKMVVATSATCTKSATVNCQSLTADIATGENYVILAVEVVVNDAGAGVNDVFNLGAIVLAGATTAIDPAAVTAATATVVGTTSGTTHGATAIAGNDITTAAGTTTLDDGDQVIVRLVLLVEGDTPAITAPGLGNL